MHNYKNLAQYINIISTGYFITVFMIIDKVLLDAQNEDSLKDESAIKIWI